MRAMTVFFLVIAALGVNLVAQQATKEFPTYTTEERWERAGRLYTVSFSAGIAYAKSIGQSPREYGEFCANLMKAGWGEPGSGSVGIIRGIHRNLLMYPESKFEITESSAASVTGRVNRPWIKHFGDDKSLYGVSLDEFEEVLSVFNQRLAEHLGLRYEDKIEGNWFAMTFTQEK